MCPHRPRGSIPSPPQFRLHFGHCWCWRDPTGPTPGGGHSLEIYSNGLAVSTQKSYSTGQKCLDCCNKLKLDPIPPSECTISSFISQLGMNGLSLSTVKSCMPAVQNMLINAGVSSMELYTPRVELIRGIKRVKVNQASSQNPRHHIIQVWIGYVLGVQIPPHVFSHPWARTELTGPPGTSFSVDLHRCRAGTHPPFGIHIRDQTLSHHREYVPGDLRHWRDSVREAG